MLIFDDLLGFGLPVLIAAGIVMLVSRMLQRHRPTEKELRQLDLTTEVTKRVARPQFAWDASAVRNRQGF